MRETLLVADDDPTFSGAIAERFRRAGIEVQVAPNTSSALAIAERRHVDVAIVSLTMTGLSTPELLHRLRLLEPHGYVFVCCQGDGGVPAILACEAGADDFFPKSTDLTLLEAKIRSAFRRRSLCVRCKGNEVASPAVRPSGAADHAALAPSGLTRFEERLLHLLSRAPGDLVRKEVVLRSLWGRDTVDPRLLYDQVYRLRRKLEDAGWTIRAERGKGYRLDHLGSCGEGPRD